MVVLALLLLAMVGPAAAASAQNPAGTQVQLAGRVLSADDAAIPLRGARVLLTSPAGRVVPATTDSDGRFDLLVPAGTNWTLRVTKAGYAPVDLPAALLLDGPVIVRMPRGAVVAGRVVDRRGAPMTGVTVSVSPAPCPDPCPPGQAPPPGTSAASTETDDLGEYRIGSLPAGRYDVQLAELATSGAARVASGEAAYADRAYVDTSEITTNAVIENDALRAARQLEVARRDLERGLERARGAPQRPAAPAATVQLRAGEETTLHLVHEPQQGDTATTGANINTRSSAFPNPSANRPASAEPQGTISGRVLGPAGHPEGAVRIQLTALDASSTRIVTTDAVGRYELTGLPAGSYRLRATKAGFPPVQYGQQRAQQQGMTIVLRGGEILDHIDVRLPPGGVITGRVVDVYGEPLEDIAVYVFERRFSLGRMTIVPAAGVSVRRTDDRGHYRIYGLLPGTYYVAAASPLTVVPPTSAITAMAARERAEIMAALEAAARAGAEAVGIAGSSHEAAGSDGRNVLFSASPISPTATIYYPGTAALDEAVPVRLDPGIDAYGVDIGFADAARSARVRGVAIDSAGEPARGTASLMVSHRSRADVPPPRTTPVLPDGSFEFTGVPPGDYVVQLVAQQTFFTTRTDPQARRVMLTASSRQEFGMQFVTVTGQDDVAISLRTSPGRTAEGRLVVEGHASVTPTSFQLEAIAADPDRSPANAQRRATPAASGTFVMADLVGPQRLVLARAPHGWYLKSAFVYGIDAADYPVSFDAATPMPGEIQVTVARGGDVSGRAVDDDSRDPIGEYSVVVFSTNPTHWHDRSRYVRLARSTMNGEFAVAGLPPGEYWVAAVDFVEGDAEWGEWQDPSFLGRLTASARRVTIAEGRWVTTEPRLMRRMVR